MQKASVAPSSSFLTATELLPTLRMLKNSEKLFLIQFLASELSQGEQDMLVPGKSYPIWSPIGANAAAATLTQMLEAEKINESKTL